MTETIKRLKEQIRKVRVLLENVTQGEWSHDDQNNDEDRYNKFGLFEIHSLKDGSDIAGTVREIDAAYIVALHNSLPIILDTLEELERKAAAGEKLAEGLGNLDILFANQKYDIPALFKKGVKDLTVDGHGFNQVWRERRDELIEAYRNAK